MKSLSVVVLSLIALLLTACPSGPTLEPIFNGKDLTGWKTDRAVCWPIENGIIKAVNDPDQKGDILFTEKSYRNFEFQMDFKFISGRIDTGVFLRDNKEQIQIGESGSLKRDMTALPYIPALRGYPVQVTTAAEVLDMEDWNTMKVRAVGSSYTTWLNGKEIMTYDSKTIVPEGPIGIQVHPKREMRVDFRNILATELPD